MSNDEWEMVGGIFRKKAKDDYSWVGGIVLLVIFLGLLGKCAGG